MEIKFKGTYEEESATPDGYRTVTVKTAKPRCRIHCTIGKDTILFNDNTIPALKDEMDCRAEIEDISMGNIYCTMKTWFKTNDNLTKTHDGQC